MKVHTRQFGELDINEQEIITFPQGIPGFEDYQRYTFIQSEESLPFVFLQSADNGELCLILTNPFPFMPEYDFKLSPSAQKELDIQEASDVTVWSVVSIREQLSQATLNLLAPIIVNVRNRQARQVILHNTDYRTKHPLQVTDTVE
jgi:flagellar assembly factor FliW